MASSSGSTSQTVHAGEAAATTTPVSNNSTDPPQIQYDVFVSFRGPDVRDSFLSHLTAGFTRKQIKAFVDDEIKRGSGVWPSIVEAIEGSSISLIIFSEDYASSHWCLDELVKILERNEKHKQIVIPIFYKVDPSDVGCKTEKYKKALTALEGKHGFLMVDIWRQALKKSAKISGIELSKFNNEADLVEEIITLLISMHMPKYPVDTSRIVGIEKPIAHLESLLCDDQESNKVCVIGIWGMGGIGKTTIAQVLFNKKCSDYHRFCFLPNVRKELQEHGLKILKEKLFTELLEEPVRINTPNGLPSDAQRTRIGRIKVLIVLDDVNDPDLVRNIFENLDWLGAGSRIIMTSRDKEVLIANKVNDDDDDRDIYEVGELSPSEALELFCLKVFEKSPLQMVYYDLSKRVIDYAQGIPLVLTNLGSHIRVKLKQGRNNEVRNKQVWESLLDKLGKMPIKEVYDIIKISYDDLDRQERKLFLDIACFFNGMQFQVGSLIKLLKDGENDNSVVYDLERLKDRALVTTPNDNDYVHMHDIIQEMGREIVRQESEVPGQQMSRLWDQKEIYEALKNNKGAEAIRSLKSDISEIWNLDSSPDVFVNKLQFLHIYGKCGKNCEDLFPKVWPTDLKYLFWTDCPLKLLPECFYAESLVRLELPRGHIQKLWHGVKNLVNLKEVILPGCSSLEELPDFSEAINLEVLIVDSSVKLENVHSSIYSLNKLQILNLQGCESLTEFASDTCLTSGAHLSSLLRLDLSSCTNLKKLPVTLENLTRLQHLVLEGCISLESIPVLPPSLETLSVGPCNSLKTVSFPSTAAEQFKENRNMVLLWNCWNLDASSRKGIETNAQINMMKLAYQHQQHPSTPEHDKDEYAVFGAWYIYPIPRWSCVPEWLGYSTVEDEMIIDLSPAQPSFILGFIFCFVLKTEDSTSFTGQVKFEITIIDGESEKGYVMDSTIVTNHLCFIYDKKCSHYMTSATKNQTRFRIKVATRPTKSKTGQVVNFKLIEFGVHPVRNRYQL